MIAKDGSFLNSSVHCATNSYARDLTLECVVYSQSRLRDVAYPVID